MSSFASSIGGAVPVLGLRNGWRQQLRPASFRGVAFHWLDLTIAGGQRYANHDYPQRDGRWHEPLGEKAETIDIEAVLIGSELGGALFSTANDLIKALDRGEAGTLIHPYKGALRVVCTQRSERYSTSEGGIIRLSLQFETDKGNRFPANLGGLAGRLAAALTAARTAVEAAMAVAYNVTHWRDFLAEYASGLVVDVLDTVSGVLPEMPLAVALDHATWRANLKIPALVQGAPATLAQTLGDAFGLLTVATDGTERDWTPGAAGRATSALGRLAFASEPVPGIGPSRVELARSADAVVALARRLALIEEVSIARRRTFVSADDARRYRDDLAGRLDAETWLAGDALDHGTARAFIELRTMVVADLIERGASLRPVTTITLQQSMPALVLAHRLYADEPGGLQRSNDIVLRNQVRHPAFVPGGVELEALAAVEVS